MRILVVEDDPKVAGLLAEALGEAGHDVTLAGTGRDGVAHALDARAVDGGFGLMILDYMLPDRHGPEVARTLRAAGLELPILMVSARDAADDVAQALASGVTDHLAKPFRLGELFDKIDELTGGAS